MGRFTKQCAAVAVAVPLMFVLWKVLSGTDTTDMILGSILAFCMVPLTVLMVYMWLGDDPARFLNTPSKLPPAELERFCRYYGIWAMVSMLVMTVGISIMVSGKWVWGLVLTLSPIALLVYPLRYLNKGVGDRRIPLEHAGPGTKFAVTLAVALLTICPIAVSDHLGNDEAVVIEWGDESFTVIAPMFDHTFRYDDVVAHSLDPDFDKGVRKWGFATSTIASGEFRNDDFGSYQLASYSKVKSCIVISVGGEIYAFNQSSVEATSAAYDTLCQRLV